MLRRAALAALATVALVIAGPLAADAHVRVDPKQAVAGADDTLLTFTVPTESGSAATTKVVIGLPTDTPFGDVAYQPVQGWSAQVVTGRLPKPARIDGTTVTEAPTSVIWTADAGTRLTGGQFQDFVLSVGPMPDTGQLRFPTTQIYSDGTVTHWSEPTPASGEEPGHPAPVLYVNDAPPPTERLASSEVGLSAAPPPSGTEGTVAIVIASAALVLALLAVLLGLVAVLRGRRARP